MADGDKTPEEQIVSLEAILGRYGYDVPAATKDGQRLASLRDITMRVCLAADKAFAAGAKDGSAVLTRVRQDEPSPGLGIVAKSDVIVGVR